MQQPDRPADAPGEFRRVVLVGATGAFGRRLAALLARREGVALVLAARGLPALDALAAELRRGGARAAVATARFDRGRPDDIAALRPWAVVDAAGPFQGAGYALPLAAVRAGAHFVDLADGRAYVAGFTAALDADARAAGVSAATGASSTPALSHAALRRLTAGWTRVDDVAAAICPGARAPAGLSAAEAILSYVGRPVRAFAGGAWRTVPGWSGLRRIEVPGLGRRWVSICDTPDLDLLPAASGAWRSALFLAGLELAPLHLGLAALAYAVRWRLVRSLRPAARPVRAMASALGRLGSDRGGMVVEASGLDADGAAVRARWSLLAEAGAGPTTPAAPAAALVRALLDAAPPPPGAAVASSLLGLDAILHELDGLPITTRLDEGHPGHPALFRRLLGRRFAALPPAVRAVHGGEAPARFTGRAVARGGAGRGAALVRRTLGLPPSGPCAVEVDILPDGRGETWRRRFGASRFASRLVDMRRLGTFEERFGPLRFAFRLDPTPRGVAWRAEGWSLCGLPLPRRLAPRMRARAKEDGGRYRFRVAVAHPWLGLLFAYRGDLG